MAEDADLIAALDSIETHKGPGRLTCQWWAEASDALREATVRNVKSKGHTVIGEALRNAGQRVTPPGIKDHVAGTCPKCQKTS